MTQHPPFNILITRSLKNLSPTNRKYFSPMSIKKEITHKYQMIFLKVSNFYFKKALNNLVENQVIQKHEDKYKFRLVPKSQKKTQEKTKSKKLKQVLKKKIIKNVAKKIVARPKKQLTNRANSSNSQKKTITENKAVNSKSEYKKGDAIWQYFDRYNPEVSVQNTDGWYNYQKKAGDIVEEEWQKYIKNRMMCDVRSVKSGYFEYSVDFMSWTQTNITHPNHKVRLIRRLDGNSNVTVNPYQ